MKRRIHFSSPATAVVLAVCFWAITKTSVEAASPSVVDPNLDVRTVVSGLNQPTSMAFVDNDEILVLEKATGRVQRVIDGEIQMSPPLDLAVNSASERGLLGIALHPQFPLNPSVYLFWTESSTGADSGVLGETPLLGNRVDRFVWNGSTLTFDRNLIKLRALQADAVQPTRGNHDGGNLRFGTDGKLYIFIGDVGRRGQLQNLPCGPTATCPGPTVPDDQFGGPEPDNAHLTGVILRLNADGSTPTDNPFFEAGAAMGGEVGANIQKIFSYGHRNSVGMAVDPRSGNLWLQENGDDSFSELNRITPGSNSGWVQIMEPVERLAQYKAIETSPDNDTRAGAFMLPRSHYLDPEFSLKVEEVSAAGIGFLNSHALGGQYAGDLFVGGASDLLKGGQLFRFQLTRMARKIIVNDRVADNLRKFDITESESHLFGRNFGISTDIQTGANGNLFVVSLSNGAIYEIFRRH